METIAPTIIKQRLDPYNKCVEYNYVDICVHVYVDVYVHVYVDVDVYVDIYNNGTYPTLMKLGVKTIPFVSN